MYSTEKERDVQMFDRIKLKRDNFVENVQAGDKKARRWLIIYCGIALFIVIGAIGLIKMNFGYKTFEVTQVIDKNDDVSVNYQVIGDGLIRYSKDGASYTDKNGKLLWNQTFEMSNAQVAACGDYMAIGDVGSNQIRIFNQAGQIAVINALYPITGVEIATQGVVAAVLSDSNDNYINLYDASGADLVKIKATISKTGYPVDIALSQDGTKLAVSYLVVSNGDVTTQIVFYKFGKTGQSGDNVVGTYSYSEIFPKIDFINNNTLVAFGEKGFEIYSMKESEPEVVLEKVFDNDIKSIFFNEQYIGFVFKNEGADALQDGTGTGQSESAAESRNEDDTQLQNGDGAAMQSDDSTAMQSEDSAAVQSDGSAAMQSDGSAAIQSDGSTESQTAVPTVSGNVFTLLGESISETVDYSDISIPTGSPDDTETEMETTDGVYPSLNQTSAETAEGSGRSEDANFRYKMLVYTNAGKLYLDKDFNFDYHSVECSNDEIIMYNENECVMFEYSGKEKFRYTFESRINSLLPKKTKNEYIVIDDNTIKEIKLK